jgi:hypothetical protein
VGRPERGLASNSQNTSPLSFRQTKVHIFRRTKSTFFHRTKNGYFSPGQKI